MIIEERVSNLEKQVSQIIASIEIIKQKYMTAEQIKQLYIIIESEVDDLYNDVKELKDNLL